MKAFKFSDTNGALSAEVAMGTIRILVVDDFQQWRLLARSILERGPRFRVVGEASDGVEAIKKAATLLPDVVLLDIGLPRLNGIEAAAQMQRVSAASKIVFMSQESDPDIRNAVLAAGGQGFVLKSQAATELLPTIEAVLRESHSPNQAAAFLLS